MSSSARFTLLVALLVIESGATPPTTNLAPDPALRELKAGNRRFVEGQSKACENATARRSALTQGQAPHAIILSCSDSRVPPENVFDQELGQIFVVRVAGNVLDSNAVASIEYAVANLGSRLVVVLGHESCGAVEAAIKTPASKDAGSPSLNHLLKEIRANLGTMNSAPSEPTLRGPVMKNISAVAADLIQRSSIVAEAVKQGRVKIEDAIYDLANGQVDFFTPPSALESRR